MEKFYTINDNYAEILLAKDIYPLVCIKKALTNFMRETYIKINSEDKQIIVQIVLQKNNENLEKIIGEFYNTLLRESLRYEIAIETKNLRELIVGRALYTTCIDLEEKEQEDNNSIPNEEYTLDEIAVNWFDKYQNEEE